VTLLAELVRASQRVGASAARNAKVRELSSLMRSLAPEEIDVGWWCSPQLTRIGLPSLLATKRQQQISIRLPSGSIITLS
jgi:hypothetical protein